jgi:hypothetical protein
MRVLRVFLRGYGIGRQAEKDEKRRGSEEDIEVLVAEHAASVYELSLLVAVTFVLWFVHLSLSRLPRWNGRFGTGDGGRGGGIEGSGRKRSFFEPEFAGSQAACEVLRAPGKPIGNCLGPLP